MPENLDKCHHIAVKAAKYVGGLIKSKIWQGKTKIEIKSSAVDFVTATDREVEGYLIATLKKHFPYHLFIGEESAAKEMAYSVTNQPTWIIDPVDGTMNFVHGYPQVCVSIALVVKKVPEIGIIYNPVLDYFFEARRGAGATLNGTRIHVSKVTELSGALLSFEFGTNLESGKVANSINNISNLLQKIQGIRSSGSAAMNMAMVALGACDAYFEFGIHVWDVAAGELIVREAGGVVIDPSGGEFDCLSRKVLCASTAQLAKQLSKEIIQYPIKGERSISTDSEKEGSAS